MSSIEEEEEEEEEREGVEGCGGGGVGGGWWWCRGKEHPLRGSQAPMCAVYGGVGEAHTPSIAFRHPPQTLPDLVTPLKGHSLSPRSCPPTRSAPSERFDDSRSNLAPKHARQHESVHPLRVRKRIPSRFKRLWFYLRWCKLCWRL